MEVARPRREPRTPARKGWKDKQARFGTPLAHPEGMGGRIQCAAHRPPREGVVTHSVVVRQIKQARQVNSHIVEISCQDRPRMGLLGASQACKNWQELPRGHAWNHFGRPNTSRRHHTGVLKRFQRVSGVSWGCLGSSRQDPKMLQRSKK